MPTGYPLDYKKWFDRFQPQTLQIATWLLYINGFFALIDFLSDGGGRNAGYLAYARFDKGLLGTLIGLVVIAAYVLGGFLMANDRKLGYRLAVVASLSPFLLRIWILWPADVGLFDMITGGGGHLISFIFEVALVALILHPQSRDHQRLWYR